ncbi:MAG: apolipoprotein N-acyltransferase [Taibaiella sp.]|jgi:apolipoprotein N-acyltransferase
MVSLFTKSRLFILLSAILCAVAIMQVQFYLAWVSLIPFFIAIHGQKGKKAFGSGATFGVVFCAVLLYWMVTLIADFSGKGIYGILFYIVALLLSALYFGSLTLSIAWLTSSRKYGWLKAFLAASIWTLGEWIYAAALPGMPWFGLFRVSNMVLDNLYAIQVATLGGAFLLSYVIVFVNYLIAHYLVQKQWKMLAVPLGVIVVYMITGYVMFSNFQKKYEDSGKPVSVAILLDNIAPDVKWNNENGSFLVKKLLDLNQQAIQAHPDIELWSEAVVPWTYRADDDFIIEVLKNRANDNVTHIMGMTTDYSTTQIYNSAYAILPNGKVAGRYDKRFPVSFAEQPTAFLSLPFSGSSNRFFEKEGNIQTPLPTPHGYVGVLICNDGTVPGSTIETAKRGAEFLVSLSNDAWFSHVKFLVRQHFYNTRLRAVEVRKDMAINCNMGSSGLVRADGSMEVKNSEEEASVNKVFLRSNKCLTIYTVWPFLFIFLNGIFILIFSALNIFHYSKNVTQ